MKKLTTAVAVLVALAATSMAIAKTVSLKGTYKTVITGKGPGTLNGGLDGTWKFKLTSSSYKVSLGSKPQVQGNYTISGSTISFTDTGGPAKCAGTGKYKFKLTGDKLKLTKISDAMACIGRDDVLTHTLTNVS
jgi:hypothetical protein